MFYVNYPINFKQKKQKLRKLEVIPYKNDIKYIYIPQNIEKGIHSNNTRSGVNIKKIYAFRTK